MQELMLILAKMLPEEKILEQIEEALADFKLAPCEETKNVLATACMLFSVQVGTKDKYIVDLMKEVKHHDRISERFKAQ